jgi:predicted transcriptional regulator
VRIYQRLIDEYTSALDTAPGYAQAWGVEVHFARDIEAQLKQFAASKGKAAAQVVEETVARMLERRAQFIEGVNRGIAAADSGNLWATKRW